MILTDPNLYLSYNPACQFPKLIGDGICHDYNNNRHCHFDGGDCCGPCVNKEQCSECECRTGATNKIKNVLVGDGFCHDIFNIAKCNFDAGDCCGSCVNTKYCSECECKGELSGIINAFLGDGFCHDVTNHQDCMFDGLDCCGYDYDNDGDYDDFTDIHPGDTTFCTECICHGMYQIPQFVLCTLESGIVVGQGIGSKINFVN